MSENLRAVNDLARTISELAKGVTLGKFLKWTLVLLALGGATLFLYYNFISLDVYYSQIETRLTILERLSKSSFIDSSHLVQIRQQATTLLADLNDKPIQNEKIYSSISSLKPLIGKIVISSLIPAIITAILWIQGDRNTKVGLIMAMPIVVLVFLLIPVMNDSLWLYGLLVVVGQIAFFFLLSKLGN
jgi:hypothetical protein